MEDVAPDAQTVKKSDPHTVVYSQNKLPWQARMLEENQIHTLSGISQADHARVRYSRRDNFSRRTTRADSTSRKSSLPPTKIYLLFLLRPILYPTSKNQICSSTECLVSVLSGVKQAPQCRYNVCTADTSLPLSATTTHQVPEQVAGKRVQRKPQSHTGKIGKDSTAFLS